MCQCVGYRAMSSPRVSIHVCVIARTAAVRDTPCGTGTGGQKVTTRPQGVPAARRRAPRSRSCRSNVGTNNAPVATASAAGPTATRARAPRSSTSTPREVRSRSATSGMSTFPEAAVRTSSRNTSCPSSNGMIRIPTASRIRTKASKTSGGSRRSATVVAGAMCAVAHEPARSQFPWWANARTTGRRASASARGTSTPIGRTRAASCSGVSRGIANASAKYRRYVRIPARLRRRSSRRVASGRARRRFASSWRTPPPW